MIDLQLNVCRYDKWSGSELHRDTITGEQSVHSGDGLGAFDKSPSMCLVGHEK